MKNAKRILSMLLVLATLCSMLPTAAFAVDENETSVTETENQMQAETDQITEEVIEPDEPFYLEEEIEEEATGQSVDLPQETDEREDDMTSDGQNDPSKNNLDALPDDVPTEDENVSEEVQENSIDDFIVQTEDEIGTSSQRALANAASANSVSDAYTFDRYLADYYVNRSTLNYYLNDDQLPYRTFVNDASDSFKNSAVAWRLTTMGASAATKYTTEEIDFYMMLIFDVLYQQKFENTDIKVAETGVKAFQASTIKALTDAGEKIALDQKISKEEFDKKMILKIISVGDLKFLEEQVDTLETEIKYTKTVAEFLEKCYLAGKMNEYDEYVHQVLTDLWNNADDPRMKMACGQMMQISSGMLTTDQIMAIFAGNIAANELTDKLLGKIWNTIWDKTIGETSFGKGMKIGQKIGKLASGALCGTDDAVENWYSMQQLCTFEAGLKKAVESYRENYKQNPTTENAKQLNKAVEMYFNTMSVGMDYAIKFAEATNSKGILGAIYKHVHSDKYQSVKKSLENIKRSVNFQMDFVNNNMYNLYLEEYGNNISYTPTDVVTTPDEVQENAVQLVIGTTTVSDVVEGIIDRGVFGSDKLTWKLSEDGILTIGGEGQMTRSYLDGMPWDYTRDSIRKAVILQGVTNIPSEAFCGCNALINVTIPNSVEIIGGDAFSYCSSLISITIPNSVTTIGNYAFYKCSSLTSALIPDSVTKIGYDAFLDCSSLTSITIPNSVTSIGNSAFAGCTSLISARIECDDNGIGMFVFADCTSLTSVTIGSDVTGIPHGQFARCTGLTSMTIPNGVTKIDKYAFSDCTSLSSITIPSSVTYIYGDAFDGCDNLTISGYTGSYAEEYAKNHQIPFKALDKQISISTSNATLSAATYAYDGKEKKPTVIVKDGNATLKNGTDYTVAYKNNINAGTATVTITGKGKYTGSVIKIFKINKVNQTLTATCSTASVIVGKTATITAKGTGTITYASSNTAVATVSAKGVVTAKAPGTVTITVKAAGNGNYNAATKTVKITVSCATPSLKKVENVNGGVKLTWGKVAGAAKYRVFYKTSKGKWTKLADTTSTTYTWKKAKNGTTYSFTVRCISKDGKAYTSGYNTTGKSLTYVATPTLSSVKNSKAKTMTAGWKKLSGVTGFQIQYSTNKNFKSGTKTVNVKKAAAVSQTINKLTKGKTYYVSIRSYKTVSGKNVYSAWSAAKSVKITK